MNVMRSEVKRLIRKKEASQITSFHCQGARGGFECLTKMKTKDRHFSDWKDQIVHRNRNIWRQNSYQSKFMAEKSCSKSKVLYVQIQPK